MEKVRERVGRWEAREKEEGRRRKRRAGCVWGLMAVGVLVFAVVMGARKMWEDQQSLGSGADWGSLADTNGRSEEAVINWTITVVEEVRKGGVDGRSKTGELEPQLWRERDGEREEQVAVEVGGESAVDPGVDDVDDHLVVCI